MDEKPETEINTPTGAGCSAATCSACRWWVLDKDDSYNSLISPYDPVTYKQEEDEAKIAEKWGHMVKRCRSPKVTFYERPVKDGATVCDGSEYMAELLTGPDFGCIHFEQNGFSSASTKGSAPSSRPRS